MFVLFSLCKSSGRRKGETKPIYQWGKEFSNAITFKYDKNITHINLVMAKWQELSKCNLYAKFKFTFFQRCHLAAQVCKYNGMQHHINHTNKNLSCILQKYTTWLIVMLRAWRLLWSWFPYNKHWPFSCMCQAQWHRNVQKKSYLYLFKDPIHSTKKKHEWHSKWAFCTKKKFLQSAKFE